ncbi:MAG: tripartite tricarboxylate transporter substrate binding protein [Acetobacteraceae bacterium]|nr:tripartite tricarboxylate transporter substrate binding protein [Acetobacteraceae bacterium]
MPRRRILLLAAPALLVAPRARAQTPAWPERPISMIVAYPAGGGTDVAARLLAKVMERLLGTSIVIVNRPGAGGEIGFTELARARPDGHVIGFINTPTIMTIPIERPNARFRLDDFAPIANVVDDPGCIWVRPASPFRGVADLVAEAKRRPGTISYGTSGVGSDDHLAMLHLERLTGAKFLHIPFAGGAPVRTAALSGQIDLGVANVGEGVADARQGLLRALGVMAPQRWEGAPDLPTFREQGFDLVDGSMRGLAAPAGVPREILQRLAGVTRQALGDPEFVAGATQLLLPLRYLDPDAYRAELRRMDEGFKALWAQHPWRD